MELPITIWIELWFGAKDFLPGFESRYYQVQLKAIAQIIISFNRPESFPGNTVIIFDFRR
jgi:hypothetical protein